MTKLVKNQNYFQIQCEKKSITELAGGGIQIEGYASTKDKDRGSDIVEPRAFKNALSEYMTNPIVLLQHNADKPIGVVSEAKIDSKGLYIKANITEDEDGIFSKLKNGVIRAFSIGYRVKDFEDKAVKDEDGNTIGLETVIKDLELFEISLVSIPMNQYALMKSMRDCFEGKAEITYNPELQPQTEQPQTEQVVEQPSEIVENTDTTENNEVVEENVEENNEEIAIDTVEENENSDVESDELNNLSNDEENNENNEAEVNENTENEVEENNEEVVENNEEEVPNEEAETVETCEEESDSEVVIEEEVVIAENANTNTQEADENSEIDNSNETDNSENGDETAPVEESNEKAVNLKELSRKSLEAFVEKKFVDMSKSFNEKLSEKDAEIKSLKETLSKQNELLKEFAKCLDEVDTKLSNTIQNGFAYQLQAKKKSAYADLVEQLKN